MALGGNLNGLRGALNEYQSLIVPMVEGFNSLNEKKGQGMFNFVECPRFPRTGERWVNRKRRWKRPLPKTLPPTHTRGEQHFYLEVN